MKLAAAITLDGLVRALRWDVHGLAEQVEAGSRKLELTEAKPARQAPRPKKEKADDRARR